MISWIKSNPLYAGVIAIVGIALVYGLFAYMDKRADKHEAQLINAGITAERLNATTEVINRVEKANDVERNPSPELSNRVRCKYDRNSNC